MSKYLYICISNEAYKKVINVKYLRFPYLLYELDHARNKNNYKQKLRALSRIELFIIDEFVLTTSIQQKNILELIDLRYGTHSTVFTS